MNPNKLISELNGKLERLPVDVLRCVKRSDLMARATASIQDYQMRCARTQTTADKFRAKVNERTAAIQAMLAAGKSEAEAERAALAMYSGIPDELPDPEAVSLTDVEREAIEFLLAHVDEISPRRREAA